MPLNRALFSSEKDDWETPQAFFDRLDAEFRFTLDAAASPQNAKCAQYLTKEDDALTQPWPGTVWLNPPYGRDIWKWIRKAYQEAAESTVVVLIPSRTDTKYWHNWVMRASEIRFVKGRLRFVGAERPCPFPSSVIVFGEHDGGYPSVSTMLANNKELP